jgi:hypothetical protein
MRLSAGRGNTTVGCLACDFTYNDLADVLAAQVANMAERQHLLLIRQHLLINQLHFRRVDEMNSPTLYSCPNDTDGDGDCHLCFKCPGGCFQKPARP